MTRVYNEKGVVQPVTVLHVGGNIVTQVKSVEKEGYSSVQVAYGDQKESRLSKSQQGHLKKAGVTPKSILREFRAEAGDWKAGVAVPPSVFVKGQKVDVMGESKGRGFAGVVKKHGMAGQPETHGSMMHRRNGSIGNRSTPGRIWKNKGMPGHMGTDRVTTQNLEVVQVRDEDGVILVKGAIPGATGSIVIVCEAIKKPKAVVAKK